jgi:hypothetical protein
MNEKDRAGANGVLHLTAPGSMNLPLRIGHTWSGSEFISDDAAIAQGGVLSIRANSGNSVLLWFTD